MLKERINFFLTFFNKFFFNKKDGFLLCLKQRNLKLCKKYIGFKFLVHNGKFFIPVFINDNMSDKLLGSFAFSRTIRLKKKIKERIKKK